MSVGLDINVRQLRNLQLKTHTVVNFVVFQGDVILVDCVPLLYPQLLGTRAELCCRQLLEVSYRVVLVTLNSDLLAKTVVQYNLDHRCRRFSSGGAGFASSLRLCGGVFVGGGKLFERFVVLF